MPPSRPNPPSLSGFPSLSPSFSRLHDEPLPLPRIFLFFSHLQMFYNLNYTVRNMIDAVWSQAAIQLLALPLCTVPTGKREIVVVVSFDLPLTITITYII